MKKLCMFLALFFAVISVALAQQVKRPIIGISGTFTGTNNATQVNSTYTNAVLRAGGVPVVLPINGDKEAMKRMIETIDALIMTGGEDIDPVYYNEEPIPQQGEIVPERDAFDIEMIRLAVERDIPLLGICRGHQLMNVAFGGTLYQDIPSQVKTGVIKHNQKAPSWYGTHKVELEKGSILATTLNKVLVYTNTFHHQAVKDVAPGFVVTARTSDGVVEGIEMKGNKKVFGVQFHPEAPTARGSDEFLPIFTYLVQLAKEKK
ncbi:MAG: gamma-glutamyl-gamma-aminobutyrate hydrolase family protein [Prevotellaceae bacterium]|jgi:putative glutamine amidotransferase|nr:gamma-glutamyl-gamma-aminobutyrate hydrolase family protein [Prevotellaceae bacterium]